MLLPATPGWVSLPVVVGGPRHSWLGSAGGVGVWCVACGGVVLVGLWLMCGVVGPLPLLAVVLVCYSPPLLAGFRCRWWWAVPATPGWGPLAAVVCGVWCWCVGGVVAGVWCGCSLATPGGGSCVLLPATPGWVSLPVVVGGPRHSWLQSAGGGGVWRWCVGGVVAGVWCGWSLATPGGGSCVLLPATPGWVSLPVVVGGPRHSWLGSAGGVGVWCVACGGGVLVGLWLVCGVVGPSPLLAVVPVCYSPRLLAGFRPAGVGGRSPPLLAGVRWRRWCVVCGVWWLVCVCACACSAWPGRAGRPPGRVLVRLTFSFGLFVFLLCLAPSGLGLPPSLSPPLPFLVAVALCCGGFFFFPASRCLALPALAPRLCLPLGGWLLFGGCSPAPLPFCVSRFSSPLLGALVFFFFSFFCFLCAPPLSPAFSGFRPQVPWASARVLFALLAYRLSALRALVPLSCFPPGCWVLPGGCCPTPPPPLCVSRFSSLPLGAVCRVVLCVPGCGAAPRCCALCRPVLCCRVLCCALLVPLLVAPCPLALPVALCSAACFAVFPRAVCSVLCVFCRGAVVRAVVRRSALCCVCPGVLCCAFPVLSAVCGVFGCAGALALCCSCGACCCWRLVLWCGLRCCWCLVLWRVPVRCGVSLGVLRCGGAALVCRGVLLCCALSCGVLRPVPCPAVPCCPAVLWWLARTGSWWCRAVPAGEWGKEAQHLR